MKMNLKCKNIKLGSPNNSCLLEFLGKGKAERKGDTNCKYYLQF